MTDPLKHPGLGRVCGVVLAGGLGRRMGATLPKALVPFRGRPMIDHVLDRLRPQVDDLIINANEAGTALDSYGADRVADRLGGYAGPLAGLDAALHLGRADWYLTVPCDSPFLPLDLAARMAHQALQDGAGIVSVICQDQTHPVFALVKASLASSLARYLEAGERKIDRWFAREHAVLARFDDAAAFLNFNTPAELAAHDA